MRTRARWLNVPNRGQNMVFVDQTHSPAAGTSLWEACPQLALLDPYVGWTYFEDFIHPAITPATLVPYDWAFTGDIANASMTFPISLVGGVANVSVGATDEDESYYQLGKAVTVAPFVITDNSGKMVFFEIRVKAMQVAEFACFVGLAEEGAAAADFLTDASGVLADKDFIGYNILSATPTAWNYTHKKAGQAVATQAGVAVNGADWHRFGFYFDGLHTIRNYINGSLNATTYLTSAATFPSGEEMSPIIALKSTTVGAKNIQIDYIKVAQIR